MEYRREKRRPYSTNSLILTITIITALGFLLDQNSSTHHGGVLAQISWTPIYVDTTNRLDLWTKSSTGCECPDGKSKTCACCIKPGGCLCTSNPTKCTQCGLEDACQRCFLFSQPEVAQEQKKYFLRNMTDCGFRDGQVEEDIKKDVARFLCNLRKQPEGLVATNSSFIQLFTRTTWKIFFGADEYFSSDVLACLENLNTFLRIRDLAGAVSFFEPCMAKFFPFLGFGAKRQAAREIYDYVNRLWERRLNDADCPGQRGANMLDKYVETARATSDKSSPFHPTFCNVSISSRNVASKSGLSWVHVQSPALEGPTSCWWRLESAPGQRIEVQVHRLLSVGSFDNGTQKCSGGFLQFSDGDSSFSISPQAIQLCAENSRYSPPVVLFGDRGIATLLLRIDTRTVRSQLAAYVSFSSADDTITGDPSKGGKLRSQSVCDWTYQNCWTHECVLASPGFPGLFPPNRRCRYYISANSTNVKIRLRFHTLSFPQPPLCATHHIAIWRGNSSTSITPSYSSMGPPWKTLCQPTPDTTMDIEGGQAFLEFRSGSTSSPYIYNGFKASVQFLPWKSPAPTSSSSTTAKIRFDHHTAPHTPASHPRPPSPHQYFPGDLHATASHTKPPHHSVLDNTEEPLGYPRASYEVGQLYPISCGHVFDGGLTRGNLFRLIIPKDLTLPPTSRDRGDPSRGLRSFGSYALPPEKPPQSTIFKCQLEFRGKPSDVVQLAIFNFKFRGSNCSTVTEVYDMEEDPTNYTDRLLGKLCGPTGNEVKRFTSSHSRMALVTVVFPYPEPQGTEFLEGAFRFHDETVEGTVKPMSSCEVVYYGVTSSPMGHIMGPPDSPLLRLSTFPLVCGYSFLPGPNQSVTLTFDRAGHEMANIALPGSKKYCRTYCGASGCRCDSKYAPMDEIDHLSLVTGATPIACLCGFFPDILPITFESHAPLMLVYHATKGGNEFSYSTKFHFQSKVTCANFTISPPTGSKRWREALGPGFFPHRNSQYYTHFQCIWNLEIPHRYKLAVEFVSEENEEDCRTWNLTLWLDDRFSLDQDRSDLYSSFCPQQGRKEIKIPDTVHNAYIRLAGVSLRPPQFEIRWKYTDVIIGTGLVTQRNISSSKDPLLLSYLCITSIFLISLLFSNLSVLQHTRL